MIINRKVASTFTYAFDGRTPRKMKAGRSYPFKADDAARFEREGYLVSELPPMVNTRFTSVPVAKPKRRKK